MRTGYGRKYLAKVAGRWRRPHNDELQNWIHLTQDRDLCQAVVKTVMNLQVP